MKTLIFNGSPRKKGTSADIISFLIQNLNDGGEVINAYDVKISPCTDCRACRKTDICAIDDDMGDIYGKILAADNIIIVSPIYFSTLTGPLLSLFSRLQLFFTSRFFNNSSKYEAPKKFGAVILTAGGSTKDFSSVIKTASIILNEMNAPLKSSLICTNTDKILFEENKEFLTDLNNLTALINKVSID